jgi:transposase
VVCINQKEITIAKGTSKKNGLPVVHELAARIDIGSRFHVVAATTDCSAEPVRTFRVSTGDLQRVTDWLVSAGVKTVSMESTGVYRVPVFEINSYSFT